MTRNQVLTLTQNKLRHEYILYVFTQSLYHGLVVLQKVYFQAE